MEILGFSRKFIDFPEQLRLFLANCPLHRNECRNLPLRPSQSLVLSYNVSPDLHTNIDAWTANSSAANKIVVSKCILRSHRLAASQIEVKHTNEMLVGDTPLYGSSKKQRKRDRRSFILSRAAIKRFELL